MQIRSGPSVLSSLVYIHAHPPNMDVNTVTHNLAEGAGLALFLHKVPNLREIAAAPESTKGKSVSLFMARPFERGSRPGSRPQSIIHVPQLPLDSKLKIKKKEKKKKSEIRMPWIY